MKKWWEMGGGIVVIVALGLGAWWTLSHRPPPAPQSVEQTEQPQRIPPTDTSYSVPTSITITHSVIHGANVYSGNIPIRSCNTFSSGLSASGSDPMHLTLTFRILDGDGTCQGSAASASDSQPFSLSFSSPASSTPVLDSVTINGEPLQFTVQEASQ